MKKSTDADSREDKPGGCITRRVFYRFRRELLELLPVQRELIHPAMRLEALIPARMRRAVWRELQARGFRLPDLQLSATVLSFSFFSVLARSAALAWLQNNPLFGLAILPFTLLTWLVTRPLAVHPPPGCQTVREAVLHATPFRRVDYEAGLWPRADIAAKVRAIIALQLGMPFGQVREHSRFVDLCGC